jgi:hypothetical protein
MIFRAASTSTRFSDDDTHEEEDWLLPDAEFVSAMDFETELVGMVAN